MQPDGVRSLSTPSRTAGKYEEEEERLGINSGPRIALCYRGAGDGVVREGESAAFRPSNIDVLGGRKDAPDMADSGAQIPIGARESRAPGGVFLVAFSSTPGAALYKEN